VKFIVLFSGIVLAVRSAFGPIADWRAGRDTTLAWRPTHVSPATRRWCWSSPWARRSSRGYVRGSSLVVASLLLGAAIVIAMLPFPSPFTPLAGAG
jgi:hypothetical protein